MCCGQIINLWEKHKAQLTQVIHWSEFLCNFLKTIPNITTSRFPKKSIVEEYAHSSEEKANMFKKDIDKSLLRGKKCEELIPVGTIGIYMKSKHFAPTRHQVYHTIGGPQEKI